MFSCSLHGWSSADLPCKACFPPLMPTVEVAPFYSQEMIETIKKESRVQGYDMAIQELDAIKTGDVSISIGVLIAQYLESKKINLL